MKSTQRGRTLHRFELQSSSKSPSEYAAIRYPLEKINDKMVANYTRSFTSGRRCPFFKADVPSPKTYLFQVFLINLLCVCLIFRQRLMMFFLRKKKISFGLPNRYLRGSTFFISIFFPGLDLVRFLRCNKISTFFQK